MERRETIEQIMADFGTLKRKLISARHQHRPPKNLTPAQAQVLFTLHHHHDITTSDLARLLGTSVSAATQLCDALIQNGYLLRHQNPKDGRSFTLQLAAKSRRNFRMFKDRALARILLLFEALSDEELEQGAKLIHKISRHLEDDQTNRQ